MQELAIHQKYIQQAIKIAQQALPVDIPIGAIITENNKIISTAYNQRELNKQISQHAEIIALDKAGEARKNWRLDNCNIYITLEPCLMCTSAIIQSRIANVYFGAYNHESSYSHLLIQAGINTLGGICEAECQLLLTEFFRSKRNS